MGGDEGYKQCAVVASDRALANPQRQIHFQKFKNKKHTLRGVFLFLNGCPRATNHEPIYLVIDWLVEHPQETFAPEDYIRSSGNLILDYKY
jgi:hypothetical protein